MSSYYRVGMLEVMRRGPLTGAEREWWFIYDHCIPCSLSPKFATEHEAVTAMRVLYRQRGY